jgi:cytochrome c peroxidase
MKRLFLLITLVALEANAIVLKPPLGLDLYMPVPESNPITPQKVEAGRRLFFDKRLSQNGTVSCASCHDPKRGFSDGRAVARGIHQTDGTRNSPALINRGYGASFFWDGRTPSLEKQVLEPIFNPKELGLADEAELERRFQLKASEVSADLASYVRTIRSGNSPFDRYAAGDARALNELEKSGLNLFRGQGRCSACHSGPGFTDERFHNTGVAWRDGAIADEGRFAISGQSRDHGAFKTPTLREIALTGPYMHDGSIGTLDDVIEFYSKGGRANPNLDSEISPRNFAPQEKAALIAFLRSLSGHVVEGMR